MAILNRSNYALNTSGGGYAVGVDGSGNVVLSPPINRGLQNFQPRGLRRWRLKLAQLRAGVLTSDVKIACIGDSMTLGKGAGTGVDGLTGARPGTYPVSLSALLAPKLVPGRTEATTADGIFGDCGAANTAYDARVTYGAGWASNGIHSIGGPCFLNSTTVNSLDFNMTASNAFDRIDVWYCGLNAGGLGTFTVGINGGAALATIDPNVATGNQKTTVNCTSGSHTINVKKTGATLSTYVIGVQPWNSATRRCVLYNMGSSGYQTSTWASTGDAWAGASAITALAPDLALICLGGNDLLQSVPQATILANFTSILNSIQGYCDFILFTIPGVDTTVVSDAQQSMLDGVVTSLSETYNSTVVDLRYRFYPYSISQPDFFFDTIHPNKVGYWDYAAAGAEPIAGV